MNSVGSEPCRWLDTIIPLSLALMAELKHVIVGSGSPLRVVDISVQNKYHHTPRGLAFGFSKRAKVGGGV